MRPPRLPRHAVPGAALALIAPAAALAAPQTTPGAFEADVEPGFRGSSPALYAGWDGFTLPSAGQNLPDDPASDITAGIEQLTPGAFITSTSNIYSPTAAPEFALDFDATGALREVVLQVRVIGSPLSDAAFTLEYAAAGGPVALAPASIDLLLFGGGGFAAEEKLVRFDLTTLTEAPSSATLRFEASAPNCSLDAVMLDVRQRADVGVPYCTAVPNSTGSAGALRALGSDRLVDDDLTLEASSLPPNQFGLFVVSDTAAQVPLAGGAGTLCLGGAIGRYTADLFNAGPTGTATLEVDASALPTPTGTAAATAGETWRFQCWHRDLGTNSNLTAPVAVRFE